MNETVATVGELSDRWKIRAKDGALPFVMNCGVYKSSFLFQLFAFYSLLVQSFLGNLLFFFLSSDDFD